MFFLIFLIIKNCNVNFLIEKVLKKLNRFNYDEDVKKIFLNKWKILNENILQISYIICKTHIRNIILK